MHDRIDELGYTVIGFEYPTKDAAGEVFERAYASLTEVSVWRTATPELDRWFIVGLLSDSGSGDADFDWGDGIDYTPSGQQLLWMVERRLGRGLETILAGKPELRERLRYDAATAPRIRRCLMDAGSLSWAYTGRLNSRPHVAVIEPFQNVALCGVNIAGMTEVQPRVVATMCQKCARELRLLRVEPQDIGLENDLV